MPSHEALILRHYFELQGFLVRQCLPNSPHGLESLQIVNPNAPKKAEEISPILFSSELTKLQSALVWVPGWSAMKVSSHLLKNAGELAKFIDKRLAERKIPAEMTNGSGNEHLKIVVVPAVPMEEPHRSETIALLKARGIASMLSIRSVLQDLIARLDVRAPREGLQLLQILSNFDLLKTTHQLELFGDERKR